MAKHNIKGRRKSGPPFVMLRRDVLDSAAWQSLNPQARCVLIQLLRRYNGRNNGLIGASVKTLASECHIKPNTVTAALNRLIAVGLIERTREAAFSCKLRLAAEYRLTWEPCHKTGHGPSNAFRLFKPPP